MASLLDGRSRLTPVRPSLRRVCPALQIVTFTLMASLFATPAADAASTAPRVEIIRPSDTDPVATKPRARVVVRVTGPVRKVSGTADRRAFALRRVGAGRYVGIATGLRRGRNSVRVDAVAPGGGEGTAFVSVTHAVRRRGLISLRAPQRNASPVTASLRVPPNEVSFKAWLNGKRIDTRFSPAVHGVRSASLSASDRVRYGQNRLRVRVVADSRLRTRAVYDDAVRTFFVPRDRPLVGAGVDRQADAGAQVRLDGRDSAPHIRGADLEYRWRIVRRPAGSRARLKSAASARPRLVTDKHGRYQIVLTTRVATAGGKGSRAATAPVMSQTDKVAVAARVPYPLMRLKVSVPMGADCYGITVGLDQTDAVPERYPNPSCGRAPGIHVLALDRSTLEPVREESFADVTQLLESMTSLEEQFTAASAPLVILNVDPAFTEGPDGGSSLGTDAFNAAVKTIGGTGGFLAAKPLAHAAGQAMIVGVPGWEPGDGFQSAMPQYNWGDGLTGFLTLDQGKANRYRFQAKAGQTQFETAYGDGVNEGTMEIAGKSYSMTPGADPEFSSGVPAWTPGEPYVHLVAVRADAPDAGSPSTGYRPLEAAFAINTEKCNLGCSAITVVSELGRMATTLKRFAGDRSVLVFVQTVGSVSRPEAPWQTWFEVGDQLDELGGSAWVWDNIPEAPNQPGNQNAYSLVGGAAIADEKRPEANEVGGQIPDPWNGGAGPKFQEGVLALNNVGWFTPAQSMPSDASEFGPSVSEIAYDAPSAWPQMDTPGKQAAYRWLNAQHQQLDLCDTETTCDIRSLYYSGTRNDDWSGTSASLNKLQYPGSSEFTAADLDAVRTELLAEFGWVDNVNTWFRDLQAPIIDSQGNLIVTIQKFGDDVNTALKPPESTTAHWFSFATSLLGDLTGIAGIVDGPFGKAAVVVTQLLSTASDLSSLADGSPATGDISAKVDDVALTINQNAKATTDAMEQIRQIILSDYGKLRQVGQHTSKGSDWHATGQEYVSMPNHLQVGTIQQAYQGIMRGMGVAFALRPDDAWYLNLRDVDILNYRCDTGDVTSTGKPFGYSDTFGHTRHSQPVSGAPMVRMWDVPYPPWTSGPYTTQPQWMFFVYRIKEGGSDPSPANLAPPAAVTDPLSVAPAPDGVFTTDPKTGLPGPGFYTPWLFGRAFQAQPFDCGAWANWKDN